MKATPILAALGAVLALSACSGHGGGLDPKRFNSPDFGESVRNNVATQSIPADPDAVNTPPEADGARQALAQQRYHTDSVKQPPNPNTSSVTNGVGGNSTGSSTSAGGAPAGTSY